MQNFIAQSMRRFGLAPKNKVVPKSPTGGAAQKIPASNEPLAHMNVEGKYAYSSLSYPLDLQSRTDLGHYMMFYVNIPNDSAYSVYNSTKKAKTTTDKGDKYTAPKKSEIAQTQSPEQDAVLNNRAHSNNAGTAGSYDKEGRSWKAGETDKVLYRKPHEGVFPKQTKRTNDAITLYMPNTGITAQHTAQWASQEMGGDIGEATGRVTAGMQGNMWGSIQGFLKQAQTKVERMAEGMAGGLAGGDLSATRDKLSNRAENKFLETFFKGVELRKWQFTWQFRPKSPEEVIEVQKIIKTFKFHSMPEFPGDASGGRFFTVPATWDIFYMYRGDENQWINKLATCVCGGVNINYSPTAWQTFRPLAGIDMPQGAPPTEIDMMLDFMETRIITKKDVLEGF